MKNDDEIGRKDKLIFIFGIIIVLLVISTSGWMFLNHTKLKVKSEESKIEVKQTQEPTAKKTEAIDYKNTEIQVLNASGKSGLAKIYADKLKVLDFVKVTTGNYEEIVTGNILMAPTDFGNEINLKNYKYEKSSVVKIILGK